MRKDTHPGTAAVLSFVFSGLGQLYNGEIKKGLWTIFFSVVNIVIIILAAILIGFGMLGEVLLVKQMALGILFFVLGLILICILGVWSITDAYKVAKRQ